MKLSDVPNISSEMNDLYKEYFDAGASATEILPLLDDFLLKHPYYPEALVFKARMLMVIGRDGEAQRYLKAAQKIDKWRLIGKFDQAEINLKNNKSEVALETYVNAIKAYTTELSGGIGSFLLGCNEDSRGIIENMTKEAIVKYLNEGHDSVVFGDLLQMLKKKSKRLITK